MAGRGFQDLAERLRVALNERVHRGEISERRLARLAGYSQPHIHNVLAGLRGLSLQLADELLEASSIPLAELLEQGSAVKSASALVLEGRLGAGRLFPQVGSPPRRLFFEARRLAPLTNPVVALLDAQERGMEPLLRPGDEVLIDRSIEARREPRFEHVYAIEWEGRGFVGRCQQVGSALVVVADNAAEAGGLPTTLPIDSARVYDVVRGCIRWIARDLDAAAAEELEPG